MKFPKGILVISSKNCGSCEVLKRNLRKLQVPFTEWDIEDHQEMISVVRSLPYVMRDGSTFMVGAPDLKDLEKKIKKEEVDG